MRLFATVSDATSGGAGRARRLGSSATTQPFSLSIHETALASSSLYFGGALLLLQRSPRSYSTSRPCCGHSIVPPVSVVPPVSGATVSDPIVSAIAAGDALAAHRLTIERLCHHSVLASDLLPRFDAQYKGSGATSLRDSAKEATVSGLLAELATPPSPQLISSPRHPLVAASVDKTTLRCVRDALVSGSNWEQLACLALAQAAWAAEASGRALGASSTAAPNLPVGGTIDSSRPTFVYLGDEASRELSTIVRTLCAAAVREGNALQAAAGESTATIRAKLAAPAPAGSARWAADRLLRALLNGSNAASEASNTPSSSASATSTSLSERGGRLRGCIIMPTAADIGRVIRTHTLAGDAKGAFTLFSVVYAAWREQAFAAQSIIEASIATDGGKQTVSKQSSYYSATRGSAGNSNRSNSTNGDAATDDNPASYLPPPSSMAAAEASALIPPLCRPNVAVFGAIAHCLASRPSSAPLAWRVLLAAQAHPMSLHLTPRLALTALLLWRVQGRPDRAWALYESLRKGAQELRKEATATAAAAASSSDRNEPLSRRAAAETASANQQQKQQPPPLQQDALSLFLLAQRPALALLMGSATPQEASAAFARPSPSSTFGRRQQQQFQPQKQQQQQPSQPPSIRMVLAAVKDAEGDEAANASASASATGGASADATSSAEAGWLWQPSSSDALPLCPPCPFPSQAFPLPLLLISTGGIMGSSTASTTGSFLQARASAARADPEAFLRSWDGGSGIDSSGQLHQGLYNATLSALVQVAAASGPSSAKHESGSESRDEEGDWGSPQWYFPRVSTLLSDMRGAGLPLDGPTAVHLIRLCGAQGRPAAALDILTSLECAPPQQISGPSTSTSANNCSSGRVSGSGSSRRGRVDPHVLTSLLQAHLSAAAAATASSPSNASTSAAQNRRHLQLQSNGAKATDALATGAPTAADITAARLAQRLLALAGWQPQQPQQNKSTRGVAAAATGGGSLSSGPIDDGQILAAIAAGAVDDAPLSQLLRMPPPSPDAATSSATSTSSLLLLPLQPSTLPSSTPAPFSLDPHSCSSLIAAFARVGNVRQVLALTEHAMRLNNNGSGSGSARSVDRLASSAEQSVIRTDRAASAAVAALAGQLDRPLGRPQLPPLLAAVMGAPSAGVSSSRRNAVASLPPQQQQQLSPCDYVPLTQALNCLLTAGLGVHAFELARTVCAEATTSAATLSSFAHSASPHAGSGVVIDQEGSGGNSDINSHTPAFSTQASSLSIDAGLYLAMTASCAAAAAAGHRPALALELALRTHLAVLSANAVAYGWIDDRASATSNSGSNASGSDQSRRLQPIVFSETSFSSLLSVVAATSHYALLLPAAFSSDFPAWIDGVASQLGGGSSNSAAVGCAGNSVALPHSPSQPSIPLLSSALARLAWVLVSQQLRFGLLPGEGSATGLLFTLLAEEGGSAAAAASASAAAASNNAASASSRSSIARQQLEGRRRLQGRGDADGISSDGSSHNTGITSPLLRALLSTLPRAGFRLGGSVTRQQVRDAIREHSKAAGKLWTAPDGPAATRVVQLGLSLDGEGDEGDGVSSRRNTSSSGSATENARVDPLVSKNNQRRPSSSVRSGSLGLQQRYNTDASINTGDDSDLDPFSAIAAEGDGDNSDRDGGADSADDSEPAPSLAPPQQARRLLRYCSFALQRTSANARHLARSLGLAPANNNMLTQSAQKAQEAEAAAEGRRRRFAAAFVRASERLRA